MDFVKATANGAPAEDVEIVSMTRFPDGGGGDAALTGQQEMFAAVAYTTTYSC